MQQQLPDQVWQFWCLSSCLSGLASLSAVWHLCTSSSIFSACWFPLVESILFSLFKFQSSISLALPSHRLESGLPSLGTAVFLRWRCCCGQGSYRKNHDMVRRAAAQNHSLGHHVYGFADWMWWAGSSRHLVIGLVWCAQRRKLSQSSRCGCD